MQIVVSAGTEAPSTNAVDIGRRMSWRRDRKILPLMARANIQVEKLPARVDWPRMTRKRVAVMSLVVTSVWKKRMRKPVESAPVQKAKVNGQAFLTVLRWGRGEGR